MNTKIKISAFLSAFLLTLCSGSLFAQRTLVVEPYTQIDLGNNAMLVNKTSNSFYFNDIALIDYKLPNSKNATLSIETYAPESAAYKEANFREKFLNEAQLLEETNMNTQFRVIQAPELYEENGFYVMIKNGYNAKSQKFSTEIQAYQNFQYGLTYIRMLYEDIDYQSNDINYRDIMSNLLSKVKLLNPEDIEKSTAEVMSRYKIKVKQNPMPIGAVCSYEGIVTYEPVNNEYIVSIESPRKFGESIYYESIKPNEKNQYIIRFNDAELGPKEKKCFLVVTKDGKKLRKPFIISYVNNNPIDEFKDVYTFMDEEKFKDFLAKSTLELNTPKPKRKTINKMFIDSIFDNYEKTILKDSFIATYGTNTKKRTQTNNDSIVDISFGKKMVGRRED